MKLNENLLNKYIDGELSAREAEEVKNILDSSQEDFQNYSALLKVHNNLKRIKEEEVSAAFTSLVMGRITGAVKRKSDSFFILSISSVLFVLSLLVIGIAAYKIISTGGGEMPDTIYDQTSNIIDRTVAALKSFKESSGFSIVGAIFSCGILISGYFFFEKQKNLTKLNNR